MLSSPFTFLSPFLSSQTLQKKPELRRSAEELLQHPWILKYSRGATAPAAQLKVEPPRPLVLDPITSVSPPSSAPTSPTSATSPARASVSRFAKESAGERFGL
jgi:hypothetical protein